MGEISMYSKEGFTEVGKIAAGELVLKFPGTDLKMLYQSGTAYVNGKNTVGQLSLAVRDFAAVEAGEAEGLMGMLGCQLAEQLNDSSTQALLRKVLAKHDTHLFYSKSKDGIEMLSLPGSGDIIEDQIIEGMVIALYSTSGEIPSADRVYRHYMKAVGKRKLVADRKMLETEVLQLVPKANGVYVKALELMKEMGF